MDANLKIERLYVLTESGQVAYDERFHPGVNIIRGENGSGKSTITHLLFYGLGGDYTLYVLTESGQVAYDERFHPGVNIIRGENGSGKSTITHLLFYGLGGDYTRFVRQAQHCSEVWVQTRINGALLTLQRLLRKDEHGHIQKQQGMTLYWWDTSRSSKA